MTNNNFIVVPDSNDQILGKLLYFTISKLLIQRKVLHKIVNDLDLPLYESNRNSYTDAFCSATGDIRDRTTVSYGDSSKTIKIYCRDNKREEQDLVVRELVKETLGSKTNQYEKLANLFMDKKTGHMSYDILSGDIDIDAEGYCVQACQLYELYQDSYNYSQIDHMIKSHFIAYMQATKVTPNGKIYFVPRTHLAQLQRFEDFMDLLEEHSSKETNVNANSLFVVDDEKQRNKMAHEFLHQISKDIQAYTGRLQYLIDSDSRSIHVIDKWGAKIQELEKMKKNYTDILQKQYEELDDSFSYLSLQLQELHLRKRQAA